MNFTFRDLIVATHNSDNDRIPSWKYLGETVLIAAVVITWFATAAALAATCISFFAKAVAYTQQDTIWKELMMISPLAVCFVGIPVLAPDFPAMVQLFWFRLEDIVGRPIVYFHAFTYSIQGKSGVWLRKILAFLAILAALMLELSLLRATFKFGTNAARSSEEAVAWYELLGNNYTMPLALLLTFACVVGWLLIRYTASQKWQAIYAKPQFNEGVLPHAPSPVANVSILHASDLHISEDDDIPITEGGLAFLKPEIQAMLNAITRDAHSCDAVLLTGDITDTGAANAWLRFLDNCPPDLQSKVLLVPGNHDLNFQDSLLAAQAERAGGAGRRRRQIRMIAAMCELMQERPLLLDRATDRIIPLKRYVERQFRKYPSASSAAAMPPKMIENLWRSLFPMVVPVGSERDGKRLGVILLDSVKPNSIGLTNAIGTLTPGTNEACRTLINRLADTCDSFVFALHHHVAMPLGGRARDRVQNPGLVLENAGVLIETLRMRGEPTIVFHGHRHKTYTGTATDSDVAIIASPSASIGKGNAIGHGSWRIADLFCSPDGCWLTDVPRRISMAGVPDDPFPPRVDPLSETLVNTPFSPHEPRS